DWKSPAERFQSPAELVAVLATWNGRDVDASGVVAPTDTSVVPLAAPLAAPVRDETEVNWSSVLTPEVGVSPRVQARRKRRLLLGLAALLILAGAGLLWLV